MIADAGGRLFHHYFVYLDAGVGAYKSASGASYTRFLVEGIGEVIAAVVHFLGLKGENVARAGHHAEVASFAALFFNGDGSMNFCHKLKCKCECMEVVDVSSCSRFRPGT